ncbi:hypothetical protein ASPWEDRAFT_179921 [Aspergillus wentii DTO 134E9]|uniref:Uncharacterized protein n=1 Tax=Aspergillus wentii DTO 134E9 TaxID=1073089 RepID=A0A1L9RU11_ASPWE|nr:uncharacterized protein ASPWEDRAFT_179921 [Aspergillus wentii DTO 134E9]KAI9933997.1 hypothetical protein MW887_005069 [Aspergillus wentii]OJJ38363.1 hypothetical protein ASPWEDRAFT_179921 [Aspergillus wentii DTO 134E9]
MDSTDLVTRAALCSSPIEVKQEILCYLPDLYALKAAILSHSTIYAAFLDGKESIAIRVLLNRIPRELLRDAALALDASTVEDWTWSRGAMTQDWTREKEAFSMQRLYQVIERFTSDFITAALSRNPALPQHPPSLQEWNRVARSFYRFEVYRHFFRNRDNYDYRDRFERPKPSRDFQEEEQWEVCYKHYAVWELEQLATVGEYLFRKSAIPFNEIAAHDVDWGSSGVNYDIHEAWEFTQRYGYIPGLLSNGLEFIFEATTAPTYEQRKRLMNRKLRGSYPFLPGLLECIFLGGAQDTPLKEYTFEQAQVLHLSETPEPDSGPAKIWKWSHWELDSDQFVWSIHCRELHAWGYVMWDNARLEKSGIYSQPFILPPPPDEEELERRKEATIASMVKRRHLFRAGAKG